MKVVKKCYTITIDVSNYLLFLSFDSKVIIERVSEITCVKKLARLKPNSTLSQYDQPFEGRVCYS
jgi:hypothetical protein